jgi:hypothetical protein
MKRFVWIIAGRPQLLDIGNFLLLLAISESSVLVRDGRDVLLIKGLAEFPHLLNSLFLTDCSRKYSPSNILLLLDSKLV